MAEFSSSGAVSAGFDLIGKRPVSVILWGVVYLLILLVPTGLVLAWLASDLPSLLKDLQAAQARAANEPAAFPPMGVFRLQMRLMLLQPVLVVATLGARALVTGAIFRAVLEPENRAYASLRFGKAELWLALLLFAKEFILGVFILGVFLSGAILAVLGWMLSGVVPEPWTGWVRALLIFASVIGVVVVSIWLVLRLSLAAPMTFAEKEFRLFESWTLTRGHSWRLLGVALLLGLIGIGIGMVMNIFLFVGAGGVLQQLMRIDRAENPLAQLPALLAALTPVLVTLGLVELLAAGPTMAIFTAPWAHIYRELARDAKPAHPPVF